MEKTFDDFIKEVSKSKNLKELILWSFHHTDHVVGIIEKAAELYAQQTVQKAQSALKTEES